MIRVFLLVPLCCATFDKWHDAAKRATGSFGSGQVMESMSPISMEMRRLRNLGGGFQTFFIFTPILGEMIQFDEHIFQMGWFNHQPVIFWGCFWGPFFCAPTTFVQRREIVFFFSKLYLASPDSCTYPQDLDTC